MGLEVVHLLLLILLERVQYFQIVFLVAYVRLFENLPGWYLVLKHVLIIYRERIIGIRQLFVSGILVDRRAWFFPRSFLSFTELAQVHYVWDAVIGVVNIRIPLIVLLVSFRRLLPLLLFECVWISFGQLHWLLKTLNLFLFANLWYLLLEALNVYILIQPCVVRILLLFKKRIKVHHVLGRVHIVMANLLNV